MRNRSEAVQQRLDRLRTRAAVLEARMRNGLGYRFGRADHVVTRWRLYQLRRQIARLEASLSEED
jgi:hypothetical protein